MPVPQKVNLIVEQASCLLLKLIQQKNEALVEQAGKPVQEIEIDTTV